MTFTQVQGHTHPHLYTSYAMLTHMFMILLFTGLKSSADQLLQHSPGQRLGIASKFPGKAIGAAKCFD